MIGEVTVGISSSRGGTRRPAWLAVRRDAGGQTFVRTLPGEMQGKWQVSTDGGNGSRWRRDGRELYFSSARFGSLVAVDVAASPVFQRGTVRPLFTLPRAMAIAIGQYGLGYDVTADGQRFLTSSRSCTKPLPFSQRRSCP